MVFCSRSDAPALQNTIKTQQQSITLVTITGLQRWICEILPTGLEVMGKARGFWIILVHGFFQPGLNAGDPCIKLIQMLVAVVDVDVFANVPG